MNNSENIQKDVPNILIVDKFCHVPETFYDRVRNQVEEIVPALEPSESYTLETLCGEEFWSNLSPGECKTAGRYMTDIVKKKRLPLVLDPKRCKHEYPKRYCLK